MAIDLVTGGAGYLGANVARALVAGGRRVRVLDVADSARRPAEAELVASSIEDRDRVREAMHGVERVFHIAFVQSLSRRPEIERYRVNVGGMRNVLDAAVEAGVARFVFASTIELYGTSPPDPCTEDAPTDAPVGWYGRHKLLCEEALWQTAEDEGLACVALRMPTICGRGFYNHRPLLSLMDRILDGRSVAVVGDGSTAADFVLLEDVVDAFVLAADAKAPAGEALNVSCRGRATHLDVVRAMIDAAGSGSKIHRVPGPLVRAALSVGRTLHLHDLPREQDGYLFAHNHYAIEKAARLIGYSPRATAPEAAAALIRGYAEDRASAWQRAARY